MTLVKVCTVADVPEGEARRFEVGGRPFAVANLGEQGFRAVDAICSHAHYFLDEGEVDVDDQTIECPKHGSTFDLNTGRPHHAAGDAAGGRVPRQDRRRRHPDRGARR